VLPPLLVTLGLDRACTLLPAAAPFDIAYGGNFYAIVEPQPNYAGLDQLSAATSST
jgi:4-hydroxyproline epimerase